jgi:hypothetical protein
MARTGAGISDRTSYSIYTLFRGTTAGTNLGNGNNGMATLYPSASASNFENVSLSFLDSPATASAQTYTLAFRSTFGSNITSQTESSLGSIILMEVAA